MAGVASPPVILAGFGFDAGGSYITTPIPYASQQPNPRASYTDGFPPQTVGSAATDPPDVRDFNGILFAATANIAAFSAGQFFQYSSAISTQDSGYALGALVASADGTGWWANLESGNTNNPDTTSPATSDWAPVGQYGSTALSGLTNANVTLTAPQAGKTLITLAGTLTGNIQIIFPPWTLTWTIVNNTTGAFTVTCKTASGTGVIVPQGVGTTIYGDGTNIDLVGTSLSANTGAVANTLALRDSSAGLTAASFNVSSDARLKKDSEPITNALERLDLMHGVTFRWRQNDARAAGVIAQDVLEVLPEAISVDRSEGATKGMLRVDAMAVVGLLVEALKQERQARRALDARVALLEETR
jgi:hypothetical protein